MISPNSRSRKVRTIVSSTKPNVFAWEKSNIALIPYVQSITIATFTKLLMIRIVASRYSEWLNSFRSNESEVEFSSFTSFISLGVNEKDATSEAETKPETSSNNAAIRSATIAPAVIGQTVT